MTTPAPITPFSPTNVHARPPDRVPRTHHAAPAPDQGNHRPPVDSVLKVGFTERDDPNTRLAEYANDLSNRYEYTYELLGTYDVNVSQTAERAFHRGHPEFRQRLERFWGGQTRETYADTLDVQEAVDECFGQGRVGEEGVWRGLC